MISKFGHGLCFVRSVLKDMLCAKKRHFARTFFAQINSCRLLITVFANHFQTQKKEFTLFSRSSVVGSKCEIIEKNSASVLNVYSPIFFLLFLFYTEFYGEFSLCSNYYFNVLTLIRNLVENMSLSVKKMHMTLRMQYPFE